MSKQIYCKQCEMNLGLLEDGLLYSEIDVVAHLEDGVVKRAECPNCNEVTELE